MFFYPIPTLQLIVSWLSPVWSQEHPWDSSLCGLLHPLGFTGRNKKRKTNYCNRRAHPPQLLRSPPVIKAPFGNPKFLVQSWRADHPKLSRLSEFLSERFSQRWIPKLQFWYPPLRFGSQHRIPKPPMFCLQLSRMCDPPPIRSLFCMVSTVFSASKSCPSSLCGRCLNLRRSHDHGIRGTVNGGRVSWKLLLPYKHSKRRRWFRSGQEL